MGWVVVSYVGLCCCLIEVLFWLCRVKLLVWCKWWLCFLKCWSVVVVWCFLCVCVFCFIWLFMVFWLDLGLMCWCEFLVWFGLLLVLLGDWVLFLILSRGLSCLFDGFLLVMWCWWLNCVFFVDRVGWVVRERRCWVGWCWGCVFRCFLLVYWSCDVGWWLLFLCCLLDGWCVFIEWLFFLREYDCCFFLRCWFVGRLLCCLVFW